MRLQRIPGSIPDRLPAQEEFPHMRLHPPGSAQKQQDASNALERIAVIYNFKSLDATQKSGMQRPRYVEEALQRTAI